MKQRLTKPLAVMSACALLGAGAGIAGSAAAPSKNKTSASSSKAKKRPAARRAGVPPSPRPGFMGGHHGVHVEAVVLNRAGDKFVTVTSDRGVVKSVSGREVTIEQKVGDVVYKTITLAIPENATIRRNHEEAQPADLKAGDDINVSQSEDGTFVLAHDDSFTPPRGRHPHHGPPMGG